MEIQGRKIVQILFMFPVSAHQKWLLGNVIATYNAETLKAIKLFPITTLNWKKKMQTK